MIKRKGHYSGTEVDDKWWKRYKKDKMFARGTGEYWYDSQSFYFKRYLTQTPMVLRYKDIIEIKTGKWHAGQWCWGRQIIKFIWQKDGISLSSGFRLSKRENETDNIIKELHNFIKAERGV